jgi:hypothetical protein
MSTDPHPPVYDSLEAWLAHAPIDEIADAILDAYSDEQIDEILELLEEQIQVHSEN